jgi:hypothetical protein
VEAEIGQIRFAVHQRVRLVRDQHLAAVSRAHDPRGPVHVHPDVSRIRQQRPTRVDAHAHPQLDLRERHLHRGCGLDGCAGPIERNEERVSRGVHLDAASGNERCPHAAVVLSQEVGVVVAELVEQPRRALDVREQEGDGPGRELAHRLRIARPEVLV